MNDIVTGQEHAPHPALKDSYFAALTRMATDGRLPSSRQPWPLESMASVMAGVASGTAMQQADVLRQIRALLGTLDGVS
jgi:hypothetical protein